MKLNTLITNIQIKKCLIVFTALLLITNYIFIGTAAALSDEQRSLYNKGINYYDIDGGCTIDNSLPNTSNNNKVYIVGDSYSVGIDQVMTKDLNDANYKVIGRNEDNAGTITSNGGDGGTPAIEAIDNDKDKIVEAGSMIVLLGTNPGDYQNDIPKFVNKIKDINKDIKLYWMTIGYRKASAADLKTRNEIIKNLSQQYDYSIVDWREVQSKDDNLISSDNVHPTDKGYKELSNLFIEALGKYHEDSRSSTSTSDKYMNTNKNQSNKKRIWSFLTSPNGLGMTGIQAAAIMGNLQHESGLNPNSQGSGSYGIAQWTGTRKTALENFAAKNNTDSSDLDAQLNNLKRELLGSEFKFMFNLLKKQVDIIKATVIFHGSSGLSPPKFTVPELEGHRGFESSGDDLSFVKNVRGGYAKGFYKSFKGSEPGSTSSSSSTSDQCLCTTKQPTTPVVFLDPGHSGEDINGIDAATGIRDHDYPNVPEINDVWDVAQIAQKDLKKDGYTVVLSKQNAQETSNLRTKSSKADSSGADIAVSIHTDPNLPNTGWITIPKVGQFRETEDGKKIKYNNVDTAKISEKYAIKFKDNRRDREGQDVVMKDISLSGRSGLAGGNIPLIMLFSDTPWIYLEKKSGNGGLSKAQKEDYAKSIVKSVKSSLPIDSNANDRSVESCSASGSGSGDIVDKILEYAWEDGRLVGAGGGAAKPAYMKDTKIAKNEGKYVGANAGDGNLFTDCGAFTTRVMQNTVDPKYGNRGPTPSQQQYLKENPEKYEALGPQNNTTKLEPGDIAIVNLGSGNGDDGHTFFYTGKINADWKGNGASASGTKLVPHASNVYFSDYRGQYLWFRYKQ